MNKVRKIGVVVEPNSAIEHLVPKLSLDAPNSRKSILEINIDRLLDIGSIIVVIVANSNCKIISRIINDRYSDKRVFLVNNSSYKELTYEHSLFLSVLSIQELVLGASNTAIIATDSRNALTTSDLESLCSSDDIRDLRVLAKKSDCESGGYPVLITYDERRGVVDSLLYCDESSSPLDDYLAVGRGTNTWYVSGNPLLEMIELSEKFFVRKSISSSSVTLEYLCSKYGCRPVFVDRRSGNLAADYKEQVKSVY